MNESSVQPEPGRTCQAPGCGTPLERTRAPSGKLEAPSAFARRQFCDHRCAVRAQIAAGRTASPWRNSPAVVGTRKGAPPSTLPPRDPATPPAERDTRDHDEFVAALELETTLSLGRHPERQPWGTTLRRRGGRP